MGKCGKAGFSGIGPSPNGAVDCREEEHWCFPTWEWKVPELWVAAELSWNATIVPALNAMAAARSLTFFEIRPPYPRQRFWLPPDCVLAARKRSARHAGQPGFCSE